MEYNLVCELGRLDAPGRPLLFGTTEEFLRSFGVQSIDELPVLSPVQVEEFKQEAEAEMVRMLPHQAEKAAMWRKTGEIHWNLRMITVTVIFRR